MAQVTTLTLPNSGGSVFRANANNMLAALFSGNSGPTAPSPTVGGMEWVDTGVTPPVRRVRNIANTAWIAEMPETIPALTLWGNSSGSAAAPAALDATTSRATIGAEPISTATSGVPGWFTPITSVSGSALSLPATGTYSFAAYQINGAGAILSGTFGIGAGGSTVGVGTAGAIWQGWAKRIA